MTPIVLGVFIGLALDEWLNKKPIFVGIGC